MKSKNRFIITFAIILGLTYSISILVIDINEIWNWLHSLFSILISLFLAYSSQIILNEKSEKKQQKQLKDKYIELLKYEINDIKNILDNAPRHQVILNDTTYSWVLTNFKVYIVDEIFRSGLFKDDDEIERLSLDISRLVNIYSIQNNNILSGIIRVKEDWNSETLSTLIDSCNILKRTILELIYELEGFL